MHDKHITRRVVSSACKQILLELNTPFRNILDKILHAFTKVCNSMIKLILRNKRYTAREYRLRYDYVVISIIRYRLSREKPPVMIKTYVIWQMLVFPEPVYRRHLVQQRVKTRYIVTTCVGFGMVYTPLVLLKGITSPNWKIQI